MDLEGLIFNMILSMISMSALFFFVCHGHEQCDVDGVRPRLCNGDYTTPGRCFQMFEEETEWNDAKLACRALASNGHLAIIDSQERQDFVNREVTKRGWPFARIGIFRETDEWIWTQYWRDLIYQGCYRDDFDEPDLKNLKTLPSGSRPTDCINACLQDEFDYASVQQDRSKSLICRCSDSRQRKYNRLYVAECDTFCANGQLAIDIHNRFCGAQNVQLVFRTEGRSFPAWAPTNVRSDASCVSLDHNHNHLGVERNCRDAIGYICSHRIWDGDECHGKSSNHIYLPIGRCLSVHSGKYNFYAALEACWNNEGVMYRPESGEEFNQLTEHLNKQTSYYFGLTQEDWRYANWEGVWYYFNWGSNQPAVDKNTNYVYLKKSDGYRWHNLGGNMKSPYVCSVDICKNESTSTTVSTRTDGPVFTDTDNRNDTGLCNDFYIGLGSGVGATILLIIIIGGIIFCRKKCRCTNVDATYKDKNSKGLNHPAIVNPGHHPEVISNNIHNRNQGSYQEIGSDYSRTGYEGLKPGYDHPYQGVSNDNNSYVSVIG